MSKNIDTVNHYLDGFRTNDHEQILSCLTDDIAWTVFGAFQVTQVTGNSFRVAPCAS